MRHHRLTFMHATDEARGRETMKHITERRQQMKRHRLDVERQKHLHYLLYCQGPACHCEQPR